MVFSIRQGALIGAFSIGYALCALPSQAAELTAASNILTNGGAGVQVWGDGVTLQAFDIYGEPDNVVFDTQFRDKGFGVDGARWDQIDYYVQYQGQTVNASEALLIDFNGLVSDVQIRVGMLGNNEGLGDDDETGRWIAYDEAGNQISAGEFGPDDSLLGKAVKEGGYGIYPIAVDTESAIYSLRIEATGFAYGEGEPRDNSRYDNESGNQENNSDFNLMGVQYTRVSGGNQPPVAVDDRQFRIREDIGPTGITYATLLANDSDPDGDDIRITGFDFGDFPGVIEDLAEDEEILFTTEQDFAGQIEFTYTITDGQNSASATIELTIIDVSEPTPTPTLAPSPTVVPTTIPSPTPLANRAPVAVDDTQFRIREDIGATGIEYSTLLANDSDPDGDSIRIKSFDFTGFPGVIEDRRSKEDILFFVEDNYSGPIEFTYTITDGRLDASARIVIEVTAIFDDPIIGADGPFSTLADTELEIPISTLLSNDFDPDTTDAIRFDGVESVENGTIRIDQQSLFFLPDAGFTGTASFRYAIESDNQFDDRVVSEPITIEVEAPLASADVAGSWAVVAVSDPELILQADGLGNRSLVSAAACAGEPATWTFELLDNNRYLILNDDNGSALEAWSRNPSDNDTASIYTLNAKAWQQWTVTGSAEDGYEIEGNFNQRKLTNDNGRVVVSDTANPIDQRWLLVPSSEVNCEALPSGQAPQGEFYLQPALSSDTIVGVDRFANRALLKVKECSSIPQSWEVQTLTNGFSTMVNEASGQAIEAWRPEPNAGDSVNIFRQNNFDWQQWHFNEVEPGVYQISGRYNDRLMSNVAASTEISMQDPGEAGFDQLWRLSSDDPCQLAL